MTVLRLALIALLLCASPATAVCEITCSSSSSDVEPERPSHANHGSTEHDGHHDGHGAPAAPLGDDGGCCCGSELLVSREAPAGPDLGDRAGTVILGSVMLSHVAPAPAPRAPVAESPPDARSPFAERSRPLLI